MLDVDAYDHAQSIFGPNAGVWRAAPERCLVGRWTPLGEIGDGNTIFRTERQGFVVLGEGTTWEVAFAAAEGTAEKVLARAIINGASRTSNGTTHGDELGPVLESEVTS